MISFVRTAKGAGYPFMGRGLRRLTLSDSAQIYADIVIDKATRQIGNQSFTYHVPEHLKPEVFIGNCASKFDDKTGELKDETTRGFIKQQLAAFAAFIEKLQGKK